MLRQLQLRGPITALQLKRCFANNAKQFITRIEAAQKLPQPKMNAKPVKQSIQKYSINIRQYSVCLNPLEPLQPEQGTGNQLNRSSNNLTKASSGVFTDMVLEPSSSVALVPLDPSSAEQNVKPQALTQINMPEQTMRKMPQFNPLRRRGNVDPARVQYIKERFKELNMDADSKKPQEKFISRITLHSGRLEKID